MNNVDVSNNNSNKKHQEKIPDTITTKKKKHKINEIEYIKKEKFDYNHHKSLYKIQKQYS